MTEEIQQLMAKEGNVKGEIFCSSFKYIKKKMGDEGLRKIEEKMVEIGYPIRLEEVKNFKNYKEAQSVLIFILCQEIFGWDDEEIVKMGEAAAKGSFVVKILLKYFVSIQRLLREAPNFWVRYFDFGELEVAEFDENKKHVIIRVKGYNFHPLVCAHHRGFFLSIAKLSVKGKNIAIDEIECTHREGKYHEYKITWE